MNSNLIIDNSVQTVKSQELVDHFGSLENANTMQNALKNLLSDLNPTTLLVVSGWFHPKLWDGLGSMLVNLN